MSKIIYFEKLFTKRRENLLQYCSQLQKSSKNFIYILPSREAITDVRYSLIEKNQVIISSHIITFDELEELIVPSIERNVISLSKGQNKKVGFMLYKEKMLSRYKISGVESKEFMGALEEKLVREIHEEIRILYVAMTRAKQHIVLTGKDEEGIRS